MTARSEALRVEHIRKAYGPNEVLQDINLVIESGEIAALLGENGAGKSSFAKILAGSTGADGGSIKIAGKSVEFSTPRDALRHGIAFIPQELIYVPDMTVGENICLGNLKTTAGMTTVRRTQRLARKTAERFGIDVPVQATMRNVSVAVQQKVEILKALGRDSSLLILDEPTAALTNDEAHDLMSLVASLADKGLAVLFISHRLDEVKAYCETAHVLRDGELVASRPVASTSVATLVADMLGREPIALNALQTTDRSDQPAALRITDFTVPGMVDGINGVDLDVAPGEVVTIYGRRGSGSDTLAEYLTGVRKGATGTIEIFGEPHAPFTNPRSARRAGLGSVPAERKSQGLLMKASISRNLTHLVWSDLAAAGTLFGHRETTMAEGFVKQFGIRCRSVHHRVDSLSGGNQQKVLIASRLAANPRTLILHEPTRGVDIGARVEIHRLLREVAASGVPMVIVTSDIEEATTVSDRLLIMRTGQIVHQIESPSADDEAAALRIAGGEGTSHAA